jgi:cytidyltransferase-like protein
MPKQSCIDTTLKYLNYIRERFEEEGVKYWLDYGSLLGAIRNKGIIPHDYDIDIGVWSRDQKIIRKIILEESNGFVFNWQYCDWNGNYNMWNIDLLKLDGQISEVKLDIYYYEKYKQNTMAGPLVYTESKASYWKERKEKCFLSKSYYYENLITVDFENGKFPVTKYYDKYLTYLYGKGCIETTQIKHKDYDDTEIPSAKGADLVVGHTEGVFDCLHYGHIRLFKRMKDVFDKVVVSCTKDDIVKTYKSPSIDDYGTRMKKVLECGYVDKVIEPPNGSITSIDYMDKNGLDYVVHGKTEEKFLKRWYKGPIKEKRMILFEETPGIRTTNIKNEKLHPKRAVGQSFQRKEVGGVPQDCS